MLFTSGHHFIHGSICFLLRGTVLYYTNMAFYEGVNVQCPMAAHLIFVCVLGALHLQLECTSSTDALNILTVQCGRMRFGTYQIFHFGVFQQLFKQILYFSQCV